jgi:hypothetical protein
MRLKRRIVCLSPGRSISGFFVEFPLEWRFCPSPGIRRCCCDNLAVHLVGTELRSLRANLFGEGAYNQNLLYGWTM